VTVGRIAFIEPIGGIAGDMFLAAALDAGLDRNALEEALRSLGLDFRLEVQKQEAGGIAGTHLEVVAVGPSPHARGLVEILEIVRASGLAPRAKEAAVRLFERIGRAEAKVHGIPLERVHFHEIGAVDSIVDVCGAAVALDLLGWPRLVANPPELGVGTVKTEHGLYPVPPPAVLELLLGLPVRPGGPPGEAVTPTGAAILAGLCELGSPPPFTPRAVGYGIGTRRWPDRPNVLRLTLGDLAAEAKELAPRRGLLLVEANLDDCPGQLVARAIEAAKEAGALDAWATPCTMKKGRPGLVLAAICDEPRRNGVVRALFAETTTLGVRLVPIDRVELARTQEPVETAYGTVRVKVGRLGDEVMGAHPEYEDCAARAREHGVAVKEVMEAALAAWRGRPG
jgi:pyridinium-3,5-bisthiocarboxylic acid mononucleotide nickel chelatase